MRAKACGEGERFMHIRIGGVYEPRAVVTLGCRVTAIEQVEGKERVYWVWMVNGVERKTGCDCPTAQFEQMFAAEDVGPLPKIKEALEVALEHLDSGSPAPHAAIEKIEEALRWIA
jgi:hypothetical protein